MVELNQNFKEVEGLIRRKAVERYGRSKEASVAEAGLGAVKLAVIGSVILLAGLPLAAGYGTGYTSSAFTSPTKREKRRLKDEMKQQQLSRIRKSMKGRRQRDLDKEKYRNTLKEDKDDNERYPKGSEREIRL